MAVGAAIVTAAIIAAAWPSAVPGNVYLNDPADDEVSTVDLQRLNGDGTRLDGIYAQVRSYRLDADGNPTRGIDGSSDFRYEPGIDSLCTWNVDSCSRFDAVNVYYHIDRFASEYWVERLGVDISFQARAIIHLPGDGSFAGRMPWTLTFGLGSTMMKNMALEDDIIYHEYTHLVTQSLGFEVDTTSTDETRALNEGIAHYFAASYTDDPRIGEWVVTCPARQHCVGPPNDTEMTALATDPVIWNWNEGRPDEDLKYGVCTRYYALDGKCKIGYHNFSHAYTWGMIWGSALWDIRQSIGADVTDRLVIRTVRNLDRRSGFEQAIAGLAQAENELHGGVHLDAIGSVLRARGFVSLSRALASETDEVGPVHSIRILSGNPISGEARLQVTLPNPALMKLEVFDVLGRRIATLSNGHAVAGDHQVHWKPGPIPAGQYFFVLTSGLTRKTLVATFIP